MEKKGQITAFAIVGIIILFSGLLFFYLREKTTIFTPKEIVPKEMTPIKEKIEQCAKILTQEAVDLASYQGGYVEIPDSIASDQSKYLGPRTEGNFFKTPRWYSGGKVYMPQLSDIENQTAKHVVDNLRDCLGDFEDFKQQYDIKELSLPGAKVVINDRQVITDINYPLEIKNKQDTEITKISQFSSEIDDSLGRKYRLAKQMFTYFQNTGILENLTMEMVSASELPTEGMEINCKKREWDIQFDITPQIKKMVSANMRYFTIKNTDSVQPDSQYNDYYQRFYSIKISDDKFKGLSTDVVFDRSWDMKVEVYPSSGGKVQPASTEFPIIGSCFKIYNHKYDIVYPLSFVIKDSTGKEPTYFRFATDVAIDKSLPNRRSNIRGNIVQKDAIANKEYCDSAKYNMTIRVFDENGNKVNNATIKYQCLGFVCEVGSTSPRKINGKVLDPFDYTLTAKFPSCSGGALLAEKEGYAKGITSGLDIGNVQQSGQRPFIDGQHENINVISLKKLDYEVKKIVFLGNDMTSSMYDRRILAPKESAIITIKSEDGNYETSFGYPQGEDFGGEMKLIKNDITYDVDIKLVEGDNYNWIGGAQLKWTPTKESIDDGSKVTFYAISMSQSPSTDEEYSNLFIAIKEKSEEFVPSIE